VAGAGLKKEAAKNEEKNKMSKHPFTIKIIGFYTAVTRL
jgi:hypothetical protein